MARDVGCHDGSRRTQWRLPSMSVPAAPPHGSRRNGMLETIAIILIILWLLGLVSSYTLGGFIHILLVIAVVVILIRVLQGRRPLG
jgi:hypothetical protein